MQVEQQVRPEVPNRTDQRDRWVTFAVLTAVFAAASAVMWPHLQDDAFIHLRYAQHLSSGLGLSYNGDTPSFGTSSLFWTGLVAALLGPFPIAVWPAAVKVLSVVFHAALVFEVSRRLVFSTWWDRAGSIARFEAVLALALLLCNPAAVRWLQDGMETSLCVLCAFGAAVVAWYGPGTRWMNVAAGAVLAAPGIVRIDLVPVTLCAVALLAYRHRHGRAVAAATAAALVGLWVAFTYLFAGAFTSDAAIAKRGAGPALLFGPTALAKAVSAGPLWLAGLVTAVAVLALLRSRSTVVTVVLGAAPLAALLAAGTAVGQFQGGARYVMAPLMFLLVVTLPLLASKVTSPRLLAATGAATVASLAVAVVTLPGVLLVGGYSHSDVRAELIGPGSVVAGVDIGELGWYLPDKTIFDLAGLVEGRDVASVPTNEGRFCSMVQKLGRPDVLVYSPANLARVVDIREGRISWTCDGAPLTYVRTNTVVQRMASQLGTVTSYEMWVPQAT